MVPCFTSEVPGSELYRFIESVKPSSVWVLTDPNTHKLCYPALLPCLPLHRTLVLQEGEANKNLETCSTIWRCLSEGAADRNALIINLGGGLLTDLGGFAASVYKRGIRFINVPTTLLAQVDAAIGGKTGIDFKGLKNQIGLFSVPEAVFSFSCFLATLPHSELLSGYAEVLKHCLIADAGEWERLNRTNLSGSTSNTLRHMVAHSAALKQQITAQDYRENGLRRILNFGHTLGHALESYFLGKGTPVPHGFCVAAGMVSESWLPHKRGLLSSADFKEIEIRLLSVFGKLAFTPVDVPAIAAFANHDKKNRNGQIGCVLLSSIGHADPDGLITANEVEEALTFYAKLPN